MLAFVLCWKGAKLSKATGLSHAGCRLRGLGRLAVLYYVGPSSKDVGNACCGRPEAKASGAGAPGPLLARRQQGRRAQTDVVEDAAEPDTLADHLDAMCAPGAPPLAWDAAGEYARSRLELYYLAHAAAPLDEDALAEVRAPHAMEPLMQRSLLGLSSCKSRAEVGGPSSNGASWGFPAVRAGLLWPAGCCCLLPSTAAHI